MYSYLDGDTLKDMLTKKDAEITELKGALSQEIACRIELKEKCVAYTELLESLKTRLEAADAMNKELHKVNTELQEKLASETKRADYTVLDEATFKQLSEVDNG